jgi:hypothetical protein
MDLPTKIADKAQSGPPGPGGDGAGRAGTAMPASCTTSATREGLPTDLSDGGAAACYADGLIPRGLPHSRVSDEEPRDRFNLRCTATVQLVYSRSITVGLPCRSTPSEHQPHSTTLGPMTLSPMTSKTSDIEDQ